jgi:hypothetical protein
MLGRQQLGPGPPYPLGVGDMWKKTRRNKAPTRSLVPPMSERSWLHPSELPSFNQLSVNTTAMPSRRSVPYVMTTGVFLLALLGALLLVDAPHSAAYVARPPHFVDRLSELPLKAQDAVEHTITVTVSIPGHSYIVLATPISPHVAVTPSVLEADAMLTGSMSDESNFAITQIDQRKNSPFSYLHTSVALAAPQVAALPATGHISAVSETSSAHAVVTGYAWVNTLLLHTQLSSTCTEEPASAGASSDMNLFANGVAYSARGDVVALLSPNHIWYSALDMATCAGL